MKCVWSAPDLRKTRRGVGSQQIERRLTRRGADHPYPSKAYTAVRRERDGAARVARETEIRGRRPNRAHPKTQQIREDDMTVIWRGTFTESQSLVDAVNRNCECEFGWGLRRAWCAAHRMLAEDQRALDGLLF